MTELSCITAMAALVTITSVVGVTVGWRAAMRHAKTLMLARSRHMSVEAGIALKETAEEIYRCGKT